MVFLHILSLYGFEDNGYYGSQECYPEGDKEEIGNQLILNLIILDFRFQPHKADALTTPFGSPLHRGRDGRKKSYQCFNVAHPPAV